MEIEFKQPTLGDLSVGQLFQATKDTSGRVYMTIKCEIIRAQHISNIVCLNNGEASAMDKGTFVVQYSGLILCA